MSSIVTCSKIVSTSRASFHHPWSWWIRVNCAGAMSNAKAKRLLRRLDKIVALTNDFEEGTS